VWIKVKRIGVFSAFKLGCFMSALPTFVILFSLLAGIMGLIPPRYMGNLTPAALLAALPGLLLLSLFVGFGPACALAFQAFLFNLFGRFFGGIALRLDKEVLIERSIKDNQPAPKVKNDELLDQIRRRRERLERELPRR
jgi:hypothetical protein